MAKNQERVLGRRTASERRLARKGVSLRNIMLAPVTQRLYRGYCAHNSQVSEARRQVLSMREALLDVLRTDTVLRERSIKQKVKYFTQSLDMIADDEVWQKKVLDACRG